MMTEHANEAMPDNAARHWARAEILAYCERTGRNPALFLEPAPPENLADQATAEICAAMRGGCAP